MGNYKKPNTKTKAKSLTKERKICFKQSVLSHLLISPSKQYGHISNDDNDILYYIVCKELVPGGLSS